MVALGALVLVAQLNLGPMGFDHVVSLRVEDNGLVYYGQWFGEFGTWNWKTGKRSSSVIGQQTNSFVFGDDHLITTHHYSARPAFAIRDPKTGYETYRSPDPLAEALGIDPTGLVIAVYNRDTRTNGKGFRYWLNAKNGQRTGDIQRGYYLSISSGGQSYVAFSHDAKGITYYANMTTWNWSPPGDNPYRVANGVSANGERIWWSDGNRLATYVLDKRGVLVAKVRALVTTISDDGEWLGRGGESPFIMRAKVGAQQLQLAGYVSALDFSPSSRYLAVATYGGKVQIYQLNGEGNP